ncbi:M50 family metallopeptidase [Cohnella hashimotonis]|uniref:M50 family metallopeptidase n=1 Tax=Cohnella hashimotonis TaxID=2826895 RepID=A0ABT6TGA5_9BACL|nr:M50 family metallopeptidase [Cohnella hashimotonis]MDI4644862.1 M50 family metallopeptidase [Cohnella hashimotonis]
MIKLGGIVFRFHPLFVLLMLLSVLTGRFQEMIALFFIVLLHELAHLWTALRFNWKVREVKLLPFGGVVETEEAGSVPVREEALVAAAGPAYNALLSLAAWGLGHFGLIDQAWADDFARASGLIAAFNLLPVLPLDGGRLLQCWFCLHFPYHRTLVWSVRISLLFSAAVILGALCPPLYGGLVHLNLLAIGLFLFASNWTYMRNLPFVFLRFLVRRAERSSSRIDSGTLAQPIVVSRHRQLSHVVRLLMKERYHLVYMMDHGKISRVLPEGQVIDGFLGSLTEGNADFRFFM